MIHKVRTEWNGAMRFDALIDGGKVAMDADPAVGGTNSGIAPKPLMLAALVGCTGMDVAALLKKMRVDVDLFAIDTEANLTDEHPKYYDSVKVIYQFSGRSMDEAKIQKAVNLSIDRYCGVFEMFRGFAKLETEIKITNLQPNEIPA
jgi:putative redox protein